MNDWCSVGEKVAVKGMRGILTIEQTSVDGSSVRLSDGKHYPVARLKPANAPTSSAAVTIAPGDYVAVSDITNEAIHAAVVKCFEAAGGVSRDWLGKVGKSGKSHKGLSMNPESNNIQWMAPSAKRQLSLQQLFTATNSIRWPDWAVDIRLDVDCVYFTDAVSKFQMFIAPGLNKPDWAGDGISENLAGTVLAVRPCSTVSHSELRPAPELGWYDWNADRARELPPVGETVAVMVEVEIFADIKILAYDGDGVFVKYTDGSGWDTFNAKNWLIKPQNYEHRKADLERDRIISAAEEVIKTTSSAVDNVALTALYEAGLLRERAV